MLVAGSHVLSSMLKPTHFTRYSKPPLPLPLATLRSARISSGSNSTYEGGAESGSKGGGNREV